MGVKVADLKRDRRTLIIPIPVEENDEGEIQYEDLSVVYRPSAYTPDLEDHLNQKLEEKWKSGMGIAFVTSLVMEWDLVETDETTGVDASVPLNEAGLRPLPSDFITKVIGAISDDMGKRAAASTGG